MLRGLKTNLCAPGPRDLTETETELCLSISCGCTCRQWTAAGTGALGVGMPYALLEEVTINPTIELPELTWDREIDSWRAQQNLVHQNPGERNSDPTGDLPVGDWESLEKAWVSGGLLQGWGQGL